MNFIPSFRVYAIDKLRLNQSEEVQIRGKDCNDPFQYLVQNIGENFALHNLKSVKMRSKSSQPSKPQILLLPGVEGVCNPLEPLANNLERDVTCLQYPSQENEQSPIELSLRLLPIAKQILGSKLDSKGFHLVGHSMGTVVALELAGLLEKDGYVGKVVLIDGSPDLVADVVNQQFKDSSDEEVESMILTAVMSAFSSDINAEQILVSE